MTECIISEKPNAAKRIAESLSDGKLVKGSENGVPFYSLTHNKKKIIVACAVGHLYGLHSAQKGFPVFNVEWVPSYEVRKGADFSKKYVTTLRKLVKQCDEFTVATDFDIEGEVIGLNIIRYIAKRKDANRMKFSTLTKDEIVEAYAKKEKHLDWGQANAGETRHKLDWFYGINISRALTKSISKAGMFTLLSTGRVQGPSLKILADREAEIKAFIPTPFWELELKGTLNKKDLLAFHEKGKFDNEDEAKKILEKTKGKKVVLAKKSSKSFKQQPPNPFDLTSLQVEAYGKIKIPPKQTLSIAQELYTSGFISYPRTSSNQLPPSIGYKKILNQLSKQFPKEVAQVLKGKVVPNNGKKADPAHPAIYPTGIIPLNLKDREKKLYELIARRFLATFGEPATRETVTYVFDVNKENFVTKGTTTREKGWLELYGVFGKQKEEELPLAEKGDEVNNPKIVKLDKETSPPKRYTEASIIKDLEKRNLGTKATRANIIDTLFQRKYVEGKQLTVTDLGMKVAQILEKTCPLLNDEEMTRQFEEDMEKIREDKIKPETVLKRAQKVITEIIDTFDKKQKSVGADLKETFQETRDKQETLGKCPYCNEGVIKLRRGKFGRFAACDKYPDCKTTYSLPSAGLIEATEKVSEKKKVPIIMIIRKGKRPMEVCLDPDENGGVPKTVEGEGKTCEKCNKGKMILRKSLYGAFLGCDQYPKCKNIVQIKKEEKKEDE